MRPRCAAAISTFANCSSSIPKGGIIRFANERALLLDAVAMGLLRKS